MERKRKLIHVRRKRNKRNDAENDQNTIVRQLSAESAIAKNQDSESSRPKWMLDFNDCTICLDCYKQSQSICGLPCGHNYHNECIIEWLIRGNHCCPICRWPSYRFKHPRQMKCH